MRRSSKAEWLPVGVVLAIAWLMAAIGEATTPDKPAAADNLAVSESTWPQWRGPHRNGVIEQPAWPDSLQDAVWQPTWRVELGPSYSGPIVGPRLVYTTETVDQRAERVSALDRQSGKLVWQAEWPGATSVPFFAKSNGDWIRATPALDGNTLYVAGMRDLLVALDAETGAERWRVDFVERFSAPLPAFGLVCSPLVAGEFVYLQAGGGLVKLDKHTGDIVWRVLDDGGGMSGNAFSSPVVATLAGRQQLVVQTRDKLAGVDLESGAELWSQTVPAFRGMNILTPTVLDDVVFTSSYGGRSFAYRIALQGERFSVSTAWSEGAQGYMSSPVVIDGHAYLHLRNQRFTCFDLAKGERVWTTTPFGPYWSLVANGDRILALDADGKLRLVRATPEKFDLIDSRTVSESSTWAHLAVAGEQVLVRELNALAVYRWARP